MGLFNWLGIGTPNKDEKGFISRAADGLDAMFHTDQERSEASQKIMDTWIEMQKTIAGEKTDRSRTRRIIAVMFIFTYLGNLIAGTAMWRFNPDWAAQMFASAKQLNTPVLTVVIFYFGYYAVANIKKAK